MAIKTIDLSEVEPLAESIYEACLIIAQRARVINADRIAKRKEKEILEDSGFDPELDAYDREFMVIADHEKEVNPTVIAQNEFFGHKILKHYLTEEETPEINEPSL